MTTEEQELIRLRTNLNEGIRLLHSTIKDRLPNIFEWDPKGLLVFDQMLTVWCADAYIRMVGLVEDPCRSDSDWWKIFAEALSCALGLTVEPLAKLAYEADDGKSMFALIAARIDRAAIRKEIVRRLKGLRTGKDLLDVYHHNSPEAVKGLIKTTRAAIQGMSKPQAKKVLPYDADLIWSLDGSMNPSDLFDPETKTMVRRRDILQDSLLAIMEDYEKARQAILKGDWDNVSPSICSWYRQAEDPQWDIISREILKTQIEESFRFYLPILNGEMEKSPKGPYNVSHNRRRRAGREPHDNSAIFFDDYGETKKKSITQRDKMEFKRICRGNVTEGTPENAAIKKKSPELRDLIEKGIDRIVQGSRKSSQIKQALCLILFEGDTEKEACKKAGITDRTIRDYLNKLRMLYPELFKDYKSEDFE